MKKEEVKNTLEFEKIIVNSDDELIDVLSSVQKSNAKKLILTFTEHSDILISPINLKVILNACDELDKPVISLIIQNPTGIRNAKEAGMTVIENTGTIQESAWAEAENSMIQRKKDAENTLKFKRKVVKEVEEVTEEIDEGVAEDKTEFQKRIEQALEKSKTELERKPKIVEENGVEIAIDEDIKDSRKNVGPTMTGKSFKNIIPSEKVGRKLNIPKINLPKITLPQLKGGIVIKIIVPIIVVIILSLLLAYYLLPYVKAKIYVESKKVSVEKVFTGNADISTFDLDTGKVPVKKEVVEKSASSSIKATGTGYRGNRAIGNMFFVCYVCGSANKEVTLAEGTQITSSKGLVYVTTAAAQFNATTKINQTIPISASNVGEEYNVAQGGDTFTVQGYSAADFFAQNVSNAIEGGTKTPYVILSKADVDKAVENLKKDLFSQSGQELSGKSIDGWSLIEDTVKEEIDGDPTTDIPIGQEADTVNLELKTKVSGLFYQLGNIESSINQMLINQANNQSLFEGVNGTLTLNNEVEKEIKITEIKKENIKVSVKASSWISPDTNKEEIIKEIKGKSIKEGSDILSSKSSKEIEVTFQPEWFPAWLRYFPNRQGRIYLIVEKIDSSQ